MIDMIIKKMPKAVQDAWPRVQELLKDKEIANDIAVIMGVAEKEIGNVSKKHCGGDKKLKEVFNDVSASVSIAKDYVQTGSLPKFKMMGFAPRLPGIQDKFQYAAKAYKEKHPSFDAFKNVMMNNTTCVDAAQRIILKTDGKDFTMEEQDDGTCKATELISGQKLSFIIPANNYAELKQKLTINATKKGNENKPKP